MFDHKYDFRKANIKKAGPGDSFHRVHIYAFKVNNEKYIFRAEEFKHHLYAVKFYPKNLELSDKKYQTITNKCKGRASHIIGTCLHIMLDIKAKDLLASFCFKGTERSDKEETGNQTQRFKIYEQAMSDIFAPLDFTHYVFLSQNAYLLLSNANDEPDLLDKIQNELESEFDFGDKSAE